MRAIAAVIASVLVGFSAASGEGAGAAVAQGSAPAALERFEYRKILMGVEARIVLFAPDEGAARAAASAALDAIAALDLALSDWRDDSELAQLCRAAGTGPVEVSEELLAVLARAREIGEASGGAFDVTVGPMVRLWREARRSGRLPLPGEIARARELCGWDKLALDQAAGTVELRLPGMRLDLGGIGKGFACDRALAVLSARGIESALVEMGGDIAAGSPPPGREDWTVAAGCADPARAQHLRIARQGVATSGDTEQHVEVGGVRYSHILDPRTGIGLTSRLCATVVAPDGATADALASAASVLGREAGSELVARFPGARLVVEGSGR